MQMKPHTFTKLKPLIRNTCCVAYNGTNRYFMKIYCPNSFVPLINSYYVSISYSLQWHGETQLYEMKIMISLEHLDKCLALIIVHIFANLKSYDIVYNIESSTRK